MKNLKEYQAQKETKSVDTFQNQNRKKLLPNAFKEKKTERGKRHLLHKFKA